MCIPHLAATNAIFQKQFCIFIGPLKQNHLYYLLVFVLITSARLVIKKTEMTDKKVSEEQNIVELVFVR